MTPTWWPVDYPSVTVPVTHQKSPIWRCSLSGLLVHLRYVICRMRCFVCGLGYIRVPVQLVRCVGLGKKSMRYSGVIMSAMASQITGVSIVCSTVYSADQENAKSPRHWPLRGIHRWPVDSPPKGPVTRKVFSFYDVIIESPSANDIHVQYGLPETKAMQIHVYKLGVGVTSERLCW